MFCTTEFLINFHTFLNVLIHNNHKEDDNYDHNNEDDDETLLLLPLSSFSILLLLLELIYVATSGIKVLQYCDIFYDLYNKDILFYHYLVFAFHAPCPYMHSLKFQMVKFQELSIKDLQCLHYWATESSHYPSLCANTAMTTCNSSHKKVATYLNRTIGHLLPLKIWCGLADFSPSQILNVEI